MSDNPITDSSLLETETFYKTDESEPKTIEPTDDSVTPAPEAEQDVELEAEDKPEGESEASDASDEGEDQFIELDDKEVALSEIREWRDKGLRQSDYTKKTTALAEERKEFEAERSSSLENIAQATDWVALKDEDPDRYIELKEKSIDRKEALDKIRAERLQADEPGDPALIEAERQKLWEANPDWLDDGKPTEKFKEDQALMHAYTMKAGYQGHEFGKLMSHHLITILKAAKYDQLQEKGREIRKKRDKVPVVTKPKGKSKSSNKSIEEVFYG
jgi:hypothetical protein